MPKDQWFMDDDFKTPLPEKLSEECARVYGRGESGIDFAQGLASFLDIEESRKILILSLVLPDFD